MFTLSHRACLLVVLAALHATPGAQAGEPLSPRDLAEIARYYAGTLLRSDSITVSYGQSSAGDKIVLQIHQNESTLGRAAQGFFVRSRKVW